MNKDLQSRKWQITINNPIEKNLCHEEIKKVLNFFKSLIYYCMADEIGLETNTPHTHVFFVLKSATRFSTVKKRFSSAHIEPAKGTNQENKDYILKEGKWKEDAKKDTSIIGTFEEFGELPQEHQGFRGDLSFLYQMVKDGKSNYEIMEIEPDYLLRIPDIERCRQIIRNEEFKEKFRNLNVTYIYGATGTGKSRYVLEKHGYGNCYRVNDYKNPFDAYNGESILILDEYRSQFPMFSMLNYLDGYPLSLPARYANKVACFETVYIISNISLSEQYMNIQREERKTWRAFLRRIQRVIHFTRKARTEYTTKEFLSSFIPIDDEEEDCPFTKIQVEENKIEQIEIKKED